MNQYSKTSIFLLAVACLSIASTGLFTGLVAVPLISHIAEYYNSVWFSKIFFILPSFVILPFLLAAKILSKFFTPKQLILSGMVLYALSGFALLLLNYQIWVIFFRCMIGVASGLVIPFAPALISQHFAGKSRDRMLAALGLMTYLFGIPMFLVLGYVIGFYWKLGYLIFLVALVPLFLIYKFVPDQPRIIFKTKDKRPSVAMSLSADAEVDAEEYINADTENYADVARSAQLNTDTKPAKQKFSKLIWLSLLFLIPINIISFSYFGDLGFLLSSKKLGGDLEANIVFSITMLSGFISNLVLMFVKKFNIYILRSLQLFLLGSGFLLVSLPFININAVYVAAALFGLGYGNISTSIAIIISRYGRKKLQVNALLFHTFFLYLAQAISPFITQSLYDMIGITVVSYKFLTSGLILLAMFAFVVWRYVKIITKRQLTKDKLLVS